jgi:2-beta-glucuronyltransferase
LAREATQAPAPRPRGRALVISSVHDPRMKRRGSIQAIARALSRKGYQTRFLSIRFSPASLLKRDPRSFLWARANCYEVFDSLECYLWRTPFHPFAGGEAAHDLYARWPNADVDAMLGDADVVIVESGLGIALLPRIRSLNGRAVLIYRGSDALDTIGAHPHLQTLLERYRDLVDHYVLLARPIARQFGWAREKTFFVGPAIDPSDYADAGENPYRTLGVPAHAPVAVSVGSMLFDASFFELAAPVRRDMTFVVIGCGRKLTPQPNVIVIPETSFKQTIPYLRHASVGLAPYLPAASSNYLAESSLKLTQYAYLGLPAVCPHFAVGGRSDRFGYAPGDASEIEAALKSALGAPAKAKEPILDWDAAVDRILEPTRFDDTRIEPAMFAAPYSK